MQMLGAYVLFLLALAAVGLAIIFGAIVSVAAYEGIAWMRSQPQYHAWGHWVLEEFARGRIWIENEFQSLRRELRITLFHT
jgi:hypothetical protein